jgi:hypothetical protein
MSFTQHNSNQQQKPSSIMKTQTSTIGRKTKLVLAAGATLLGFGLAANAQLAHYYQFSTGSGNDQVGSANGTLMGGATITGGALVTAGGNGTVDGIWGGSGPMMTLDASAVSGITGAFTIVDWYQATSGWPKFDTAFAFSDGAVDGGGNPVDYLLGSPVRADSGTYPSGVGFEGAGGALVRGANWDYSVRGKYLDDNTIHQTVLTYDGTTLSYYVDGAPAYFSAYGWPDTATDPGFNLSMLTHIAINGGSPYNDPALTGSTYSFAIFNQGLTASQVAADYGLGANASASQINVAMVPEPGTMALMALAGLAGQFLRRSFRSPAK